MPVIKSEIHTQSQQANGYRVKFKYTFADGREFFVGSLNANNQEQIDQLLLDKKAPLELSIKNKDAQDAQQQGITVAHKDATQSDVYYAYLFSGYNVNDPIESYELMAPVAQEILDLGLTVEQMATLFNEELEVAQGVFDRWAYLSANKNEILAYKAIKEGI